jgi:hypothetical protein
MATTRNAESNSIEELLSRRPDLTLSDVAYAIRQTPVPEPRTVLSDPDKDLLGRTGIDLGEDATDVAGPRLAAELNQIQLESDSISGLSGAIASSATAFRRRESNPFPPASIQWMPDTA